MSRVAVARGRCAQYVGPAGLGVVEGAALRTRTRLITGGRRLHPPASGLCTPPAPGEGWIGLSELGELGGR